jgi:ribosome-associated toxin RatA of RatAB toxin-antitoxin module
VTSDAVRQTLVVAADAATIMGIVADLDSYPQWQPDITDLEILETGENGWARRARFEASAMGRTVSFELEYTYTDTEVRWRLVESDLLTRNDGSYVLVDQGDGTTQVTYELDVDLSIPVPGFMRRQIANHVVSSALQAVKRRAEAQAGRD